MQAWKNSSGKILASLKAETGKTCLLRNMLPPCYPLLLPISLKLPQGGFGVIEDQKNEHGVWLCSKAQIPTKIYLYPLSARL
jgi:hypothetical protein